jgi:hypothetical protein
LVRFAAVGLALAACGRFGFDPDTAVVADARDGNAIADATHVAPAFVQATDLSQSGSAVSVTYANSVTAGDLLVVAVGTNTSAITAIIDSNGDEFDMLPELVTPATSPMYVAFAIARMSGSDTITAAIDGSDFAAVRIHEYTNVAANPLDTYATSSGSDAGIDAISVELTTAYDHELVFAYAISENDTASAGTGFTARSIISGDVSEDAIEVAPGVHAITATDASSPWAIVALAFEGS